MKPLALLLTLAAVLSLSPAGAARARPPLPPAPPPPAAQDGPGPARPGSAAQDGPGPALPSARPGRTVALTFDDGPSEWTPQVLEILRRHRVTATFCMVGIQARRFPAYAREVVTDGHQLCNHSADHADLARLPARAARREVVGAERQIRDAAGVAPTVFRFPYGSADRTARNVVRGYGMRVLSWDVDPGDGAGPAAATIPARIVGRVRPGSIVLMHDGGGDRSHTVASLDATIVRLQHGGYRFVAA